MGGRAGGGASGGMGSGSRGGLQRSLDSAESAIKDSQYENAFVFDEKGNLIYKSDDVGASTYSSNAKTKALQQKLERIQRSRSVYVPPEHIPNHIVTHNHPNNDSFSSGDIQTALGNNAKEFRAKGSTRTFSIKRPKGGWPDTAKVLSAYKSIYAKTSAGPSRQHETMKALAKQFELNYTWK